MLKGLTSDLTGTADITRPLKTFEAALGTQYVLPNEKILFSLQSSKEEFTFTNQALLRIQGSSATTTRKLVTRFDYKSHTIDHVRFETAGRVDRDVEIKFRIGSESVSIDIAKDEEVVVRDYYKVLELLSRAQKKNERTWDLAKLALKSSSEALYLTEGSGQTLPRQSEEALNWLQDIFERTHPHCYRDVIQMAFEEIRTNSKMLPRGRIYHLRTKALWPCASTKRIERYEFVSERVAHVTFETCDVVNRDCEIKLHMCMYSIDIAKAEQPRAQQLYRVLQELSRAQADNAWLWDFAKSVLEASARCPGRVADANTLVAQDMAKRGSASALTSTVHAAKKRKLATSSRSRATREADENHSAVVQRLLARRFEQAARVREKSHAVLVQLRRQRRRIAIKLPSASISRAESNSRLSTKLRVLMEMAMQLQIHLLQQQTRFEPRALRKVRWRLDDMTARAAMIKNLAQRVRFLMRRMVGLVEQANKIGERRQEPGADSYAKISEGGAGEKQEARRPLAVELAAHQWVPPILWSIYESVERARMHSANSNIWRRQDDDAMKKTSKLSEPREELHAAMQRLMEQIRELNPYSHLHVVYRPPPAAQPGQWVVRESSSVQKIANSLSHRFTQLHHKAFWLESPRSEDFNESVADCERKFASLIDLVRNLSTHFHYAVLYFYSIAMERADLNASPSSIARQAATHLLKVDLREAYGLSPSLLVTSDTLLRQTYAYFPEVLVFLDEWRREESVQAHGFATSEEINECIVDFRKSACKDQRTRIEIAACLKDVFHAWRRSKLGTNSFEMMQIAEIGALEQLVKGRLGYVTNLLYQQNIAAWVQRLQRLDVHGARVLSDLRIMVSATKSPDLVATEGGGQQRELSIAHSKSDESSEDIVDHLVTEPQEDGDRRTVEIGPPSQYSVPQDDVDEVESISDAIRREHPENGGRFRAPGVLNLSEQCSATKSAKARMIERKNQRESIAKKHEPASDSRSHHISKLKDEAKPAAPLEPLEPRHFNIAQLKDIYAWTDEQIDAHEHEKEHINELQQQLSVLRDKMSLNTVMQERMTTWVERRLPQKTKTTLAMLEAWSRVREYALTAVCCSDTIALHGAAEALIQRPSLRLDQEALRGDRRDAADSRNTIIIDHSDDDAADENLDAGEHKTVRLVREEDELESLRELKETIGASRHSVAEMLKRYNGEQTKEWFNHVVFFAQASKSLLEIAHERMLPSCSFQAEEAREIQCVDSNAV